MAFASSRIGAQEAIIKPCDLCEDDEDVNWFCKDCFQNLCDRCKKMHLKIPNCRSHEVVSILEGIAITKEAVTNLCQDHNVPFSFFCRTCDENICSKCLSKKHKKHDIIDIHEFQSELHKELDTILNEKETEKEQMTKNLVTWSEFETRCEKTLRENYTNIDKRVKAITSAATEEGEKLKKYLQSKEEGQMTESKESKEKIEARKDAYNAEIQVIKQNIPLQTTSTLNQFVKTSVSRLQSLKPLSLPMPRSTTFTIGSIKKDQIRDMIGRDGDQRDASGPSKDKTKKRRKNVLEKLQIMRSHKLDIESRCYSMCASPDGSIWIGGYRYVYKMSSDCSTVLHQIPTRESLWSCHYISCLQSGDAVVSYGVSSPLDRFTSGGRSVEFADLSPNYTSYIAVSDDDKVAIAVYNDSGTSSSVVLFSKEGKRLNTIETDTEISSFCIDNDGNYVISDTKHKCLTTIDRNGTVLKKIQMKKSIPQRMTCDRYGNILGVIEKKYVFLMNDEMKVQQSFTVDCDYGINDMCIDKDNRLSILVDNTKVIVAKYLE
ncbi:hypothetical protein FSP39_011557 [Pinctada imbricata]|uniref:B box-type domain-containing protein n=1 Tax=Pinctada imbricata TaxID=66713 RepID=A0AA88YQR7_PINIB|nr:hypothetical protein FSP39_011557 [Pinctada imbricata]